jgi:Uma2 family endonuclease
MSPSGHTHGKVAARVTVSLGAFVEDHQLGEVYAAETGFRIRQDPDTVRAPDVAFVAAERLQNGAISLDGYFPGPPDLAVEVISPTDAYTDVEAKVAEWLQSGALAVVVLDPRRKGGAIYRAGGAVALLTVEETLQLPELLPGWSLPLSVVFR